MIFLSGYVLDTKFRHPPEDEAFLSEQICNSIKQELTIFLTPVFRTWRDTHEGRIY
jgi:hypothetical protein